MGSRALAGSRLERSRLCRTTRITSLVYRQVNVVFRCDASELIGSGHVMRCLTLADALAAQGAGVTFVSRALPGNLLGRVSAAGHEAIALPAATADDDDAAATAERLTGRPPFVLVTDHYGIDARWHRVLRPSAAAIAVIDDAAEHELDCDIVLDQTPLPDAALRYRRLAGAHAQLFLGLRYALLRREFEERRGRIEPRVGVLRRVLVFLSAANYPALTARAIVGVRQALPSAAIDVIGVASDGVDDPNVHYHPAPRSIVELMLAADLAIGALGHAAYERAFCALPSLVLTVTARQAAVAAAFAEAGLLELVPGGVDADEGTIAHAVGRLAASPAYAAALSRRALSAMAASEPVANGSVVRALFAAAGSPRAGR